ncbi:hypothetical protein PR202_ga16285 [Eleusine coracana subsp. coracana]|uniref:Peptidase S8/S53 domain-containing protein n=1 Tax=Eleusine coracana subsp. coracana TaxID=191504 RepID=A0AAV5CL49_ELECO|nr:hypothetical protein PR202_ga16285 [Eleusine coracana subsp. coracana]
MATARSRRARRRGAQSPAPAFWAAASGIAPLAQLAVYEVCSGGNNRSCEDADVLAGIDAALSDGADVLSLSLGGASKPFHHDPVAIGAFAAVKKGVLGTSFAASPSHPYPRAGRA